MIEESVELQTVSGAVALNGTYKNFTEEAIELPPAREVANEDRVGDKHRWFKSVFPIVEWLPEYSWGKDFLADLIAGCTLATMHIPLGMGYALIAFLPPFVGLYMGIFPVLVYFLLGTARHNSMGAFAAVCIVLGKSVVTLSSAGSDITAAGNGTLEGVTSTDTANVVDPIGVAAAMCLACAFVELIVYSCRLGMVCHLLSDTLISAIFTGAGYQVLTSQMRDLLGLPLPPIVGSCRLFRTYVAVFSNIDQVNLVAILFSGVTIMVQLINNDYLKSKVAKFSRVPIPMELLLMISGIIVSRHFRLHDDYGIKTLGPFPTGFPTPVMPNLNLLQPVLGSAFMIVAVAYIMSVSKALSAAKANNYRIDFNQELLAMGTSNIFGCFFSCLPIACCPARTTAMQALGGRSQIAAIVCCGILITVLLWIGPVLESLPVCIIAGIIAVSLKGLLLQVTQYVGFWRRSYLDGILWMGTFVTIVLVSIDVGIVVGLGLSFLYTAIRWTQSYTSQLENIPNTDLYVDVRSHKGTADIPRIKIFRFCGSLNFLTIVNFRRNLYRATNMDLSTETNRLRSGAESKLGLLNRVLVIDFTALNDIDSMAESTMNTLINQLGTLSIGVFLVVKADNPMLDKLRSFLGDVGTNKSGFCQIFPAIHDAVLQARNNIFQNGIERLL
ncbi:anion exchange transporter-like [Topomyia yanbarensis]|uniref:anion exchange transporter-like n=1 Tax=Topomyia yanbarensis TaxID=2498891 RepID=UPI00273B498F|nr:anion exchange transporter-like [Topomyia yanbarensis]